MSNRMLVLVGLPGSGKSTIAHKIVQCKQGWQRINQDDMRSRKACEMYAKKFLDERQSVIIDRCNFDRDQRRTWIELARHYKIPVDCIVLTADQKECGDRIVIRENHPTGVVGREGLHILRKFVRNYRPPRLDGNEGFSRILYLPPSPSSICTAERVDEIFALLEQCPLLIPDEFSSVKKYEKPQITIDTNGWSTIPLKSNNSWNNSGSADINRAATNNVGNVSNAESNGLNREE